MNVYNKQSLLLAFLFLYFVKLDWILFDFLTEYFSKICLHFHLFLFDRLPILELIVRIMQDLSLTFDQILQALIIQSEILKSFFNIMLRGLFKINIFYLLHISRFIPIKFL